MGIKGEKLNPIENLILEKQAISYGDFTLSSGKKSHYYVNCKALTLDSEALRIIAKEIALYIEYKYPRIKIIGGVLTGPATIIGAILFYQGCLNKEWKGFLIRKETKDHGLKNKIDGNVQFQSVILIEDTITTGETIIQGINAVKEQQGEVKCVIAVIDRNEGAEEKFKELNIPYYYLYRVAKELK
jgi:orotate phosphoribosyltransferase